MNTELSRRGFFGTMAGALGLRLHSRYNISDLSHGNDGKLNSAILNNVIRRAPIKTSAKVATIGAEVRIPSGVTFDDPIQLAARTRVVADDCSLAEVYFTHPTASLFVGTGSDLDNVHIMDIGITRTVAGSGKAIEFVGPYRMGRIINLETSGFDDAVYISGAVGNFTGESWRINSAAGTGVKIQSCNGFTLRNSYINNCGVGVHNAQSGGVTIDGPVLELNGIGILNEGGVLIINPWVSSSPASANGVDIRMNVAGVLINYGSASYNMEWSDPEIKRRSTVIGVLDRDAGDSVGGPAGIRLGRLLQTKGSDSWVVEES